MSIKTSFLNFENLKTKEGVFQEIKNHRKAGVAVNPYELLALVPKEFLIDKQFMVDLAEEFEPGVILEFSPKTLQTDKDFLCALARIDGTAFVLFVYDCPKAKKVFNNNPEIAICAIESCYDPIDLSCNIMDTLEDESEKLLKKYPEILKAYAQQLKRIEARKNEKREKLSDEKLKVLLAESRVNSLSQESRDNMQGQESQKVGKNSVQKDEKSSNQTLAQMGEE